MKKVEVIQERDVQATPFPGEIYVDMDGVLADFFDSWAKLMKVDKWWNINKQHNMDDALQKIRDTDDFWLNIPLTPNAKNLLNLIKKVKGSYNICSSPLPGDPKSEPHKQEWIKKHLAFFPPKNIYITHDKAQFAVQKDGTPNILIDDYGVNIRKWEEAGGIGFKHKDHKFERTVQRFMKGNNSNLMVSTRGTQTPKESYKRSELPQVNKKHLNYIPHVVETVELELVCPVQKERITENLQKQYKRLKENRFVPIVVDKDYRIINGHHRYEVLKQLNSGYVEVARIPLTLEEVKTVMEKWSAKYKKSIDCSNPKGFSQKAHCAGRKKTNEAFIKPNFDYEWEEANRYPEFQKIGKDAWIELAKKGEAVTITSAKGISNTDATEPDSFSSLDKGKQARTLAQLEKDEVEMPIVAVYSDGHKELIGGNTRLTALMAKKIPATVWQFDVPDDIANLAVNKKNENIEESIIVEHPVVIAALAAAGVTIRELVKRYGFNAVKKALDKAKTQKPNLQKPANDHGGYVDDLLKAVNKKRTPDEIARAQQMNFPRALDNAKAMIRHASKDLKAGKLSREEFTNIMRYLRVNFKRKTGKELPIDDLLKVVENFADGKKKGKSRPGRVKRAGASCKGSVTSLRKKAKNASGEKAKMYHWCANMKAGRNK